MKKLYFLLLTFLMASISFGQVIITELADPNNDAGARYVEIYNVGSSGFDLTGWELRRWTNGNVDPQTSGVDLSPIGTLSAGSFAIIAANATQFQTVYGFAPDIDAGTGGPADSNGDDQIAIFDASDTTIDIFGVPGEDGSNTCHEFEDGRAERIASATSPSATWNEADWNVWADTSVSGCTSHTNAAQDAPGIFDPGSWIGETTSCGVVLGVATYTCSSNTVGDGNDGVTIQIPYSGSNAGITSVTTTAAGASVFGDDPAVDVDGTIVITGLSEGDAWDITLNGGDCDGTTTSGTVPADECDPAPNTCFDLSGGAELFELVVVTPNSDGDEWLFAAGTYSMNGFVGGAQELVETWLIFGPLDMSSVTDLTLAIDAAENFGTTDLVVAYTSSYSGCPSGSSWTTAQTITDAGAFDVDLSSASGTDVFIGIQYLDDGVDGYSGWELSNVVLEAFGTCPTLGTRPTSDCATCDLALQTENYVCLTNTAGDNNDAVTVEIPYTGSENTITSVTTTSGGTVGGDDPSSFSDGTITITGLSEGDTWDLTINGGDCDGTTISGTIPSAACDPPTMDLVINEILADPDGTTGDANGDGTVNTSQDEFVEIFNIGASSIDISGYTIEDGASLRHTFPASTILPANSFITIFGGGTPTGFTGLTDIASSGSLGFNNGGDTVTIKNTGGVTVAEYTYGSEGGSNQSICREPDFTGAFVQHLSHTTNPVQFSPDSKNDGTTLSAGGFEISDFKIYPNPTNTGIVNITSVNSEVMNAEVFDILGKQVMNQNIENNQLNVSNLNAGVYILRLTQNNASITKKLVIQ